ncbi:MAG TPA: response regulator transcription factor [Solirubrobacteraceae bacterium]|nr:response regulator transcription factor [Solirubrobacteraceae bacterium]
MRLKIVIADDHPMMLAGIARALEESPDIEVVGTTTSGSRVLPLVSRNRPDIALLDLHMPGRDGIECLKLIRERHPEVKCVMLSASQDPDDIESAFAAGASAYIVKRVQPTDIASALRQVFEGTVFHPMDVATAPATDRCSEIGLTAREKTVLEGVARGLSTKAISSELWVTEQTVKFHLGNIYRKLGVANRAGALRYAFDNRLVDVA